VLVNVSRGLATPITLESDHNDVLAARDSGFLQIYCATCQEVLDAVLIAYRLAEHPRVRLPAIVNLDGFYLSFTREPVEMMTPEDAASFLPQYDAADIRFRASKPISQAVAVLGGSPYSYFRYESHLAAQQALPAWDEIADEFARRFGRRYEAVERYRSEDAEIVFFMIGAFATKAMDAVDRLREAGIRAGLVRPRLLRPYPRDALRSALRGRKAVAVIDQNLSMGMGGVLYAELAGALYGEPQAPLLASYVGGLGGRDLPQEEFFEIARELREALARETAPAPRLLYTADELRQMRKLQAVASAERDEIGGRR
jgi:pyruvate ferredoxin oxidoreductase alpha subunit